MRLPARWELDLTGRVVAITGAASGIGEATALACAEAGAPVALADMSEGVRSLAERIERGGSRAAAVITDVGEEHQAQAFIEQTRDRLGSVDVLVNNTGVMRLGPIDGADTGDWREMVHTNVMGVLYCTRAVLPVMRAQGSGHIVNVSSMSGRRARAGTGVYSLTKFGINGFSDSLREEAAADGIKVTVIEPGLAATPATTQGALGARFAGAAALEAADIAQAILYALAAPTRVRIDELVIRPAATTR
jgi:NADP-dependent 3-hydroxy acid dehydrogenase YdfG